MADVLHDFDREPFRSGGIEHDVYRYGSGPAVIVISEVPGITPNLVRFARWVAERGLSVALPDLFGEPGKPPTQLYALSTLAKLCISKEFAGLAMGRTGPVVDWLRALAAAEHGRCGGPGVGVVGMCYTGGFGLAMAVDDIVLAPVLSQPSLPFPFGAQRKRDVQLSEADWEKISSRASDGGLCVMGLRFTGDKASPPERFDTLRRRLGENFIAVELDSSPGNSYGHPRMAHSVLTEHLADEPGTPTRQALDQVLDFFTRRLAPAP